MSFPGLKRDAKRHHSEKPCGRHHDDSNDEPRGRFRIEPADSLTKCQ